MYKTSAKAVPFFPLFLVYTLFFTWGFIWNLFNVLAAFFKETFSLSNTATSLGTSLSFLAFFLMAYPSKVIISRIGTQNAISLGSLITGTGLLVFIPASFMMNYGMFITGLFILFSGVTILQTVCNPYIGILGDTRTRAARINFAQGVGAVGAALTAPIGGWFILELYEKNVFNGIKWFYLILAVILLLLSVLVRWSEMPENRTEQQLNQQGDTIKGGAFRYRHFVTGFIIMFVYMGAEAILYQLMTPYFKEIGEISTSEAVKLSAILFYGLMTGRFFGAWIMTRIKPDIILGIFSLLAATLVTISMLTGGKLGIYAITATGFFISIIFASVFSLATTDLGKYTYQASSYLIMGISGGFFVPLIFGIVADRFSMQTSLLVVIIPLLLTSFYGFGFNLFLIRNKKTKKISYAARPES